MALSDKQILEQKEKGDIVIEPFIEENISTSSYDVTLGEYFFFEKSPGRFQNIYNPYDEAHVEKIWGKEPSQAQPAKETFKHYKFEFEGIEPDDKVIVLDPGETILAHTNEFIGGKKHITTMMKARSSLGRNFIEVCKCAGWGDVGYVNRWTMEITNNSKFYSIPLVVGRRVAQIIFFETGEIRGDDYTKDGKYQSIGLEGLKENWDPSMMIPKMYNDREVKQR
ncbi:MAG: deoxycytidine triphosphate deaminase [Candidatus Campbellbacteria bacterium]|nr:deoxycytidine triphosphate deaminase [Candidatus Campbellbacteria bacterium]